jgi:hypothetical protein
MIGLPTPKTGKTIREVAKETNGLNRDQLDSLLDAQKMVGNRQTQPGEGWPN